ncbi:organellar and viral DNA polymerase type B, partial [Trichomonas vaginalis G3]|uniref:organellar and viral DNA polymerase type B n=1 Tax=Trichomonas vaginalis (strain ATCC PRA-98 / G3) TaxID=412133 RepID=UPI0021E544C6
MQITGLYKGRAIIIKDSYSVINKKLKLFPAMFNLQTGPKEVFPYNYYSSVLLANDNRTGVISEACKFIRDADTFMKNIDSIKGCRIDENHFDLEKYSTFYCKQDVRILREGFVKFRNDILKEFDLNVYDYVSICSIANKLFENRVYFRMEILYDLSNKPREFISRCIQGGRCMLSDNMKQKSEKKLIADFDAVSLYPSAYCKIVYFRRNSK